MEAAAIAFCSRSHCRFASGLKLTHGRGTGRVALQTCPARTCGKRILDGIAAESVDGSLPVEADPGKIELQESTDSGVPVRLHRNNRMSAIEFLRLSMQLDLRYAEFPAADLPAGFSWVSWKPVLVERHARVKWRSFREESDSRIFPSLGEIHGCRRLMRLISGHACFCPDATWMVTYQPDDNWPADDCATIQVVVRGGRTGAIQNVGVVSAFRGLGIGRALMLKSLRALQGAGLTSAILEVTAENAPAVQLYKSLGFEVVREFIRTRERPQSIRSTARPRAQTPRRP